MKININVFGDKLKPTTKEEEKKVSKPNIDKTKPKLSEINKPGQKSEEQKKLEKQTRLDQRN